MDFLKKLGQGFKKLLGIGTTIAVAAEPWVDLAVPEISGLFNSTLQMVVTAEGLAEQTGQNATGSGATKAAATIPALMPIFEAWAQKNGVQINQAQVQAANDAAVAFVKALPAVTAAVKG